MRISDWSSDVCSSDLVARPLRRAVRGALLHRGRACEGVKAAVHPRRHLCQALRRQRGFLEGGRHRVQAGRVPERHRRSEEHTSELQSLMRISYAVFCLKKKKTKRIRL